MPRSEGAAEADDLVAVFLDLEERWTQALGSRSLTNRTVWNASLMKALVLSPRPTLSVP